MHTIPTKFDGLLPNDAAIVEARPGSMWEVGLMPEEIAFVQSAIPSRRKEFTAGRNCARDAMELLGCARMPILVGLQRAPVFPLDLSGTITHTRNYCAAAVIRKGRTLSIGIDAETNEPLGHDIGRYIMLPEEKAMTVALPRGPAICWDKLVFSTKEAFYKAFFQISPIFVDFLEAQVEIFTESQAFLIRLLRPDVNPYFHDVGFRGRYFCDGQMIYSAIALDIGPR